MSRRLRLLILGGYGTFGGRVARLLADEPRLHLLIAGRSLAEAEAFVADLGGAAGAEAATFDRDGDVERQLRALEPDVVVDATGPFQAYGARPYRVVEACLAVGANYMDLADASGFVAGIGRFEEDAQARGLFVLAGVSSFPVLTAAVVRSLARDLDRVTSITGGIAPSPYAGVGLNVIRAISSYAGKPLPVVRGGAAAEGYGLTETMRCTIAPPRRLPLRNVLFSLVDVPDLRVLPELWPGVERVWMGAGPVPEVLHRVLVGLAWLVRDRILSSLSPFARLFHWATNVLRWGEHRGGMFVRITGERGGRAVERAWHMIAEGDDGPFIPSMAVEAIIRAGLDGRPPEPGARPATGDLELEDYEALFARRAIATGRWDDPPPGAPLYQRLLGSAWDELPAPVREMHTLSGERRADGEAQVERGRGPAAWLAGVLFGFPRAGAAVPVEVSFSDRGGVETWRRRFAGRAMTSTQAAGRGRSERLLVERFGPFTAGLALVLDGAKLRLVLRRWSLLGVPLPLALAPKGEAWETAEAGRFRFHVEIRHPLGGLLVRYRGWLEPR